MSSKDMTPERWERIQTMIDTTLPMDPAARAREIRTRCDGDEDLIREVEEYLRLDDSGDFLERPVRLEERAPWANISRLNTIYGPYRTVEKISTGGMGDVYKAVEGSDFDRVVALKLIKRDVMSDEVVARFHNERKILSQLEHPNIARLYGGGETPDGLPYFAMEYVDGIPIDQYCNEHRLDVRARLELFLDVCAAVEVAHNHLVVHRDIKPGNILVTEEGVAKLLDFGIARPLVHEMMARTVHTSRDQAPMTVRYASPEMIRAGSINIASDIYTLGVVLYELLTGRLPCDLDNLSGVEIYDAIRKREPARPSTVVRQDRRVVRPNGSVRETPAAKIARARSMEIAKLQRRLSGDLDAIVLKALAKEPRGRYANARDFAADLRRHLEGEPVRARQWTFFYGAGKFIRRNRWLVATATTVLIFVIALTQQYFAAQEQRDRAETVTRLMEDIFKVAEPEQRPDGVLTGKDLFDGILSIIREEVQKNPAAYEPTTYAKYLDLLARSYNNLGHYQEARELWPEALEIWEDHRPGDHSEFARMINNLGFACYRLGDYSCAENNFRRSLEMKQRLGQPPIEQAKTMFNLAACYNLRGAFDEAFSEYRKTLHIREAEHEEEIGLASTWLGLGSVEYSRGRFKDANAYFEDALRVYLAEYSQQHTRTASANDLLGRVALARGSLAVAEKYLDAALETRLTLLGDDDPATAKTRKSLVDLRLRQGRTGEAKDLFADAVIVLESSRDVAEQAEAKSLQGALLLAEDQFDAAEPMLLESYQILRENRSAAATVTCLALDRIVALYKKWERPDRAAPFRETQWQTCPWASQRKASTFSE